jgi:hypothetical protein
MTIGGVVLLVLACVAFFLAARQQRRVRALESTQTVACNALVEEQVCEVAGQAAGYQGLLGAPVTGQPCVWWRRRVTQHWQEWDRDAQGNSTTDRKSRVVEDRTSEGNAFVLRDAGGQVFVDPRAAKVDKPFRSYREIHGVNHWRDGALSGLVASLGRKMHEQIELEEWMLRDGEVLFVRGRTYRTSIGLMMVDPGDGHYLISTRSEEQLTGSARRWTAFATALGLLAAAGGAALVMAGAAH